MFLTVLILAKDEEQNLRQLLPLVREELLRFGKEFEFLIVDGGSRDGTAEFARQFGARVIRQNKPGYGEAFREGMTHATSDYVLALDADQSHPSRVVGSLLERAESADIVIASRYVPGGAAQVLLVRRWLSVCLNWIARFALGLTVRDCSSGYRVYRLSAVRGLRTYANHFDILVEILALAARQRARIIEVPFVYEDRVHGSSHVRYLQFFGAYARTLFRLLSFKWFSSTNYYAQSSQSDVSKK